MGAEALLLLQVEDKRPYLAGVYLSSIGSESLRAEEALEVGYATGDGV